MITGDIAAILSQCNAGTCIDPVVGKLARLTHDPSHTVYTLAIALDRFPEARISSILKSFFFDILSENERLHAANLIQPLVKFAASKNQRDSNIELVLGYLFQVDLDSFLGVACDAVNLQHYSSLRVIVLKRICTVLDEVSEDSFERMRGLVNSRVLPSILKGFNSIGANSSEALKVTAVSSIESCLRLATEQNNLKMCGIQVLKLISPAVTTYTEVVPDVFNCTQVEHIIREIIQSERTYHYKLKAELLGCYIKPIKGKNLLHKDKQDLLASNIGAIIDLSAMFLESLESSDDKGIGQVVLDYAVFFKLYTQYVDSYDSRMIMLSELKSSNSRFKRFLNDVQRSGVSEISSLLILPVQRIPRYCLLIESLIKATASGSSSYRQLLDALEKIEDIAMHVNSSKMRLDNLHKLAELQERIHEGIMRKKITLIDTERYLIKEGEILRRQDFFERGAIPMEILSAFNTGKSYNFYLFTDLLMWTSISSTPILRGKIQISEISNVQMTNITTISITHHKSDMVLELNNESDAQSWFSALNSALDEIKDTTRKCSSSDSRNRGNQMSNENCIRDMNINIESPDVYSRIVSCLITLVGKCPDLSEDIDSSMHFLLQSLSQDLPTTFPCLFQVLQYWWYRLEDHVGIERTLLAGSVIVSIVQLFPFALTHSPNFPLPVLEFSTPFKSSSLAAHFTSRLKRVINDYAYLLSSFMQAHRYSNDWRLQTTALTLYGLVDLPLDLSWVDKMLDNKHLHHKVRPVAEWVQLSRNQ